MKTQKIAVALALLISGLGLVHGGPDRPTEFTNRGSIANTRHNMTQRPPGATSINAGIMDFARNDYGEVCVYCHTPHGADSSLKLPLWNRTTKTTTYKTYNELGTSTLTQAVSQPGANSLSCLSCHDGQTAIDSIINMPGSRGYQANRPTGADPIFLDSWNEPNSGVEHQGLNSAGCLSCHAPGVSPGATDFTLFALGTDLTNDHPVGVTFPTTNGPGTDFKAPTGLKGNTRYFDSNNSGSIDTSDVRLYDEKVECASCHDPHGVPSAGAGSTFIPTFLRVKNTGSAVCLTCHIK